MKSPEEALALSVRERRDPDGRGRRLLHRRLALLRRPPRPPLHRVLRRLDRTRLDDPAATTCSSRRGTTCPRSTRRFAELGFLDRRAAGATTCRPRTSLYWHPNRAVPGVEFHSGSLGHLLSVGIGIALDIRLRGPAEPRRSSSLGDGELNEGSIWEALPRRRRAEARQPGRGRRPERLPGQRAAPRSSSRSSRSPAKLRGLRLGVPAAATATPSRRSTRRFAALPCRTAAGRRAVVADTVRGKGLPTPRGPRRPLVLRLHGRRGRGARRGAARQRRGRASSSEGQVVR